MSKDTTTGTAGQDEGVAGVGMFVAAFVDERAADAALEGLKEAKRSGEFYYDDAAVIRRDAEGKLHIKETGDMSTGKGAGIGALVGGRYSHRRRGRGRHWRHCRASRCRV